MLLYRACNDTTCLWHAYACHACIIDNPNPSLELSSSDDVHRVCAEEGSEKDKCRGYDLPRRLDRERGK